MAEAENVAVPETKKKSKMMLWIILGATVLLMGGGGFLVTKYMRGAKSAAEGGEGAGKVEAKPKSMMNLESFLVNLTDADNTRFVKVTFRLGIDEAGLGEELASDPVVLAETRDKIIRILSTKTAEEILTIEGKDKLREEIRTTINKILPQGKVVDVFIMDFVVQL
jgi:flagellar FliL protein